MSRRPAGFRIAGLSRSTLAAAVALGVGLGVAPALSASATNAGTASGNHTTGCALAWNAETIMDVDGASDVPAALMVDLDGRPVDYSNGGYVEEVSPKLGNGPGKFEIQHWVQGTSSVNWRVFVGTDHAIKGAKLTLQLPDVDAPYAVSDVTAWGATDNAAVGGPWVARNAPSGLSAVTVDLGDMAANSQSTIQFTAPIPADRAHDTFTAKAQVSGTYVEGAGCAPTLPSVPVTPTEGPCQQVLTGRTVMPIPAPDITVGDKAGGGGETNADGWGSGDTRTFRLYGATDRDLTDVTFTARAAQGLMFRPAGGVDSPANGQLPRNGYTGTVTGASAPVISADGTTVTVTIARMPARSAFSVNVAGVLDGSGKAMVIDEVMTGTQTTCATGQPGEGRDEHLCRSARLRDEDRARHDRDDDHDLRLRRRPADVGPRAAGDHVGHVDAACDGCRGRDVRIAERPCDTGESGHHPEAGAAAPPAQARAAQA